jgi:uncharacterized SAM-binding protein YcdF (DUF218 family)
LQVFLFTSKALLFFLHPLGLSVLLLATALFMARRRPNWTRRLCAAALAALAIFSCPVIANVLKASLENQYPDHGIQATPAAEVIVVLGGGLHTPNSRHRASGLQDSGDRILHAFRLYRAGKASSILCSGGGVPAEMQEAEATSLLLQEWGVPPEHILVEAGSRNTRENALFSYRLLKDKGVRRILLVTSAFHMPRAAAVFRKLGLNVTPAPADFSTGWDEDRDWLQRLEPDSEALMDSDIVIKEWIGLFVYRLCGWA